jgi:hypothetical protein
MNPITAERWAPIPDWPEYSVSNRGRIRSEPRWVYRPTIARGYRVMGRARRRQVSLSVPGVNAAWVDATPRHGDGPAMTAFLARVGTSAGHRDTNYKTAGQRGWVNLSATIHGRAFGVSGFCRMHATVVFCPGKG